MAYRNATLILKGCPKCGGDLTFSRDIHGEYVICLQCGLLKDVAGAGKTAADPRIRVLPKRKAA